MLSLLWHWWVGTLAFITVLPLYALEVTTGQLIITFAVMLTIWDSYRRRNLYRS